MNDLPPSVIPVHPNELRERPRRNPTAIVGLCLAIAAVLPAGFSAYLLIFEETSGGGGWIIQLLGIAVFLWLAFPLGSAALILCIVGLCLPQRPKRAAVIGLGVCCLVLILFGMLWW